MTCYTLFMSRRLPYLLLSFSLLFPVPWLAAGPLEDGHTAFDNKDYKKAYELWMPLAEEDNPDAQYNLGLLYMKGLGVEKSDRRALVWFVRAGNNGLADAQYNAGVMFYLGRGVYPDHKSAVEWWQRAAEQEHANAQNNLAIMYAFGYGIGSDKDKALELWAAAARQGHPDALDSLINAYSGRIAGFKADPQQARYWEAIRQAKK